MSRLRAGAIAGALIGLVLTAGCGSSDATTSNAVPKAATGGSATPARSILLVTLDTTRADRIGAYGYARAATPTLDRLAREGVLFENAIAPTPITLPSHASILTGVYPSAHGVRDNAVYALGPEATLVSEALRGAGFRTGAFVASFVLDARFGLDQGFEIYQGARYSDGRAGVIVERRADAVVDDAAKWLAGIDPGERFFAWVHFFDPHFPYDPPPPWRSRFDDPYDAEIAFADAQLARLLGVLERRGLDDGLVVAVTADHGESLGQHGEKSHGLFLYQSSVHVPLVIAGAGVPKASGTRVARPVSTADLPATLLALAGVPASTMPDLALPSLFPVPLRDRAETSRVASSLDDDDLDPDAEVEPDAELDPGASSRTLLLETHYPYHAHRWHALRGVLFDGVKLVEGRGAELYGLADDPNEERDLASAQPDRLAAWRERLEAAHAAHPDLGWARRREGVGAERERLEALGYVLAQVGGDAFDPTLPDGRDRLIDADRVSDAYDRLLEALALERAPAGAAWQERERGAKRARLLAEARALLLEVRVANPRDPEAVRYLALVESHLGNHDEAIALFESAIAEQPDDAQQRVNLGINYHRAGRSDEAVHEMRRAIEIDPRHPQPYRWLAAHYQRSGETGEARRWLAAGLGQADLDDETRAHMSSELSRLHDDPNRAGASPGPTGSDGHTAGSPGDH